MNSEEIDNLGKKLDTLIRLFAISLLGDRSTTDSISLLLRGGLATDVIAELVGTTPATVRAAKSREGRKKGAR